MGRKYWVRVLLGVAIICLSIPAQGSDKITWLENLKPGILFPAGKGRLEQCRISEFKPAGEVQTPAGRGRAFDAVLENNSSGITVRAAELLDYPAVIVWIKFDKGITDMDLKDPLAVNTGIEFDLPKEFPRVLSFAMTVFAPPKDTIVPSAGPLLLFNDNFDSVMISPVDHFLISMINPNGKRLQVGLEGNLKSVPAGFEHPVVFYFGKGVRNSFDAWGSFLRKWHNKERPGLYADIGISYLGYWTDNGAYYYYKTIKGLNYEQTLLKVKEEADRKGVPFRYFQLDSWWYPKVTDKKSGIGAFDVVKHFISGGAIKWEARPELFPDGLEAFDRKLGLPLIAHARWFDRNNEYRREFKFVDGESNRHPAFPVEDRFWDMIMANAKKWGIQVYEQDWLETQWNMIPYLRESVDAGEKWLDAMSRASQKHGLTIQYCMANPGMFMQAVKYPNITQIRASDDYMAGMPKEIHWLPFTKTSMLAWAVGVYPWKDNFLSSSGERTIRNERHPEEEALISILSAGMVGPGDKIGFINKELLLRTCRADGMLLKPDMPAMPIDKMFVENKTLYTTITEVKTSLGTYYYVAGFNIFPSQYRERELSFADLGIGQGNYLVYSWNERKFQPQKDRIIYPGKLDTYRSAYFVLIPDTGKAPALIGEWDKFVPVSSARFKKMEPGSNKNRLTIAGVKGEEINLAFRAEGKPKVNVISGADPGDSQFDPGTHIFSLKLKMSSAQAELEVGG